MKHIKNNSYGMGGKSYRKGGKLSKQEARLLKMLMTKAMGEEGMRVMQSSGMTPSLAQRFVDEISQVASGLSSAVGGGSFSEGYSEQEARDRARTAAGVAGDTDAFIAGARAVGRELFDDDLAQGRLYSGTEADFGGAFDRAFDRAKMTDDERRAASIERTIRDNEASPFMGDGIRPNQLEDLGGTSSDLIRLLSRDKVQGTRPATGAREAMAEERERGLPAGSLYPEARNDLRRQLGLPAVNR